MLKMDPLSMMAQALKGKSSGDIVPSGYKKGQLSQFTPEQMQLYKQLFQYLSPNNPLSKLAMGDQSAFEEMEAPALRQAAALQGNLASRFSGQGLGGRHSSGFQNTSTQAMNEFASGLQSRRQDLMRQSIYDMMGLSSSLLGQRPYEKYLIGKDNQTVGGSSGNWLSGLLPLAGAGVGGLLGGIPGASLGAGLGSAAGRAFS